MAGMVERTKILTDQGPDVYGPAKVLATMILGKCQEKWQSLYTWITSPGKEE